MDETRAQAYLQLINALLTCPNGEKLEILQDNLELLDLGFLQVCEAEAAKLAEEGRENEANSLRSFASQLGELLGFTSAAGNEVENHSLDDYLTFLKLLVQTEHDNFGGDARHIYGVLQANLDKLNLNFIPFLQQTMAKSLGGIDDPEKAEGFADLIVNIAVRISEFPQGRRADNLEIAIAAYESLLSVRTRETNPEKWAMMQNNLANAYCDRIRGKRADNLEKAIAFYTAALEVRTREAFPEDWAMTQNNLATAYNVRIRGERADNLEKAIEFDTAALKVRTREAFPEKWAETQNNLANAYYSRIRGDRAENLEKAITSYTAALEVRTREAFPEQWATTQNNLATAYSESIGGERADNLEKAIKFYTAALQVYTREAFPEKWAMTQNNLGTAYHNRIREERADNLEKAIKFYTAALQVYTREAFPQDWAMTQNNLAGAYYDRIRGERADNLEMAITSFNAALEVRTREDFPQDHAETLFNLGLTYREVPNLQLAHDTFADAINTVEFLRGEIHSGDETKRKLAEKYNQIYRNMVEVCLELKNYTAAIEYAERSKARNLVELLANRDIKPKGDISETVLNELSRLRQEISTKQRQLEIEERNGNISRTMISETGVLGNRTHINQLQQKLDELINHDIKPIDPNFSLTQKVEPIPYEEIQSLTGENTAILEWYITEDKFLTFIITPQSPTPIIWQSSTADLKKLARWGKGYLRAYIKEKKHNWKRRLTLRLRLLAKILHLDEILKNIPKQCDRLILIPHRYLHLFPLHALPVSQETWLQFNPNSDSSPANPYLLDCFFGGVGYAPSCQLLQQAQRRQRPNFSHLFAIQNPTNDLDYTDVEVQEIAKHFDPRDRDILPNAAAKIEALDEQRLRIAHCAHFSCHGYFNFANPLQSALLLADCRISKAPEELKSDRYLRSGDGSEIDLSKCLTLDNIFTRDFSACRLVVLSACETGLTDFSSLSDEYIGLPSGFLVAGSPSVVSSLWAVNDLSTALLMIKFYQNLQQGLSVGLALNYAQIWLRDVTGKELQEWTSHLQLDENSKKIIQQFIRWIYPDEKRFQNPLFWAAFCAIGQ